MSELTAYHEAGHALIALLLGGEVRQVTIEHRRIFVGRVVQTYVDEAYVDGGDAGRAVTDLTVLDPIVYALDNRYYRIGASIGVGYREGRGMDQESA